MTPIATFFRNLEAKCCTVCGQAMTEQAESYMTECFDCQEKIAKDAYLRHYNKR
ncbi:MULTISPECIES: protein YhfH [Bacillales]|jgi:hypothetical protein|uniref:YhfH family protein n=1 Tax=Brevibacillus aydinogluensis TaxID=927786 RepID=A0AA48MA09_9BACL|nr:MULTISPECIES: protein YhfH [Bacillales]REK66751.1 MAG: YhfH family protein [Brevibacillus sp.]MBR8660021.1 YhfH family protein [Brevibacillus sp. NL20B1]MDT3418167.1 ribosomal protein L37AE/L43A [Brevibacillus aydinogluensis]NNV02239.1 YhfH family protein [Brevibacillus sp. MCWH]UFJ62836.1 YhfH family protein [Anoxybacillus sediminis]